jgi:hypothetical protein
MFKIAGKTAFPGNGCPLLIGQPEFASNSRLRPSGGFHLQNHAVQHQAGAPKACYHRA